MRLIDADALKDAIPETSVASFENCRYCNLLDREQVIAMSAEWTLFYSLRQRVFDAIEKAGDVTKRSEHDGSLEVSRIFPGASDPGGRALWRITLYVYSISIGNPQLFYAWEGSTFAEALDKAAKGIDELIGGLDDEQ